MKSNNSIDLESDIRDALIRKCTACALDDENDFEAVMKVVGSTIEEWFERRSEPHE